MMISAEQSNVYEGSHRVWDKIGIPARGELLFEAMNQGFSFQVFGKLAELSGLNRQEFASAIRLAPATLRRRSKTGRFTVEESDRLFRFAQVFAAAEDLFEDDAEAAQDWLTHEVRGLGHRRPVDMLGTSAETQAVLDLIGRLEHGVFS